MQHQTSKKKGIHLVLVKVLCLQLSQDMVTISATWRQIVPGSCGMAVQELTVLHSVKLVKAMLRGAGALPGALLHTVRSMGLITC